MSAQAAPFTVVGGIAVIAGVVGAATVSWWYVIDVGWTGSGSVLVVRQAPILVAALVSAASVLVGLLLLTLRRSVPLRSAGGVLLLVTGAILAAMVTPALAAYPQVQHAALIDHRNGWQRTLPVSEIWGVRHEDDGAITIEGRADRRGCQWQLRSVTLDRSTGSILEVRQLPTAYDDPSQLPADPRPLDPARFEARQGSSPFICTS